MHPEHKTPEITTTRYVNKDHCSMIFKTLRAFRPLVADQASFGQ